MSFKSAKVLVLPRQTQLPRRLDDILKELYDTLEYGNPDCDIVLDFGLIDSVSTQGLLLLPAFDALTQESGHRLILKSVPPQIRSTLAHLHADTALCFAA